MLKVSIEEAQKNLAQLIALAYQGQEIVITQEGKPIVSLLKLEKANSEQEFVLSREQLEENSCLVEELLSAYQE